MTATIIAAAASAMIAAVLTTLYVLWIAEGLRRARATQNVLSRSSTDAPANPENTAQETPAAVDRTQHTQAIPTAPPRPYSAAEQAGSTPAGNAVESPYAAILPAGGTHDFTVSNPPFGASTVSSAPILTDADDLSGLSDAELLAKGREAISRWRQAASQYRTYAEVLERSLNDAWQEAAQQRKRADQLQEMYLERTQQLLRAGTRIVIDYGPRKRGE